MKNETQKLKKGDKLWDSTLTEYTIKSVGNKYIQLDDVWGRFLINTLESVDRFPRVFLYSNKQAVQDKKDREEILQRIAKVFRGYGNPDISLDALRQINTILDNDKPK